MNWKDWKASEYEKPLFTRSVAARLARISVEFLTQCEQERLIEPQIMRGGNRGLRRRDIHHLARIRRLQEDLELDMPAVEVVLRLRQRVIELLRMLDEMERVMANREEELIAEIRALQRRMAEEIPWEKDER